MGLSDVLLNAKVGQCTSCETRYVTYAEILGDDSHMRVEQTYGCPKCKQDKPQNVVDAGKENHIHLHENN